ncbi:MAG: putative maltokinase [Verrucomicrobia bacterium]|nr:putative maltokinase [Verrucomicrobiota bacterium]
MIARISDSNDLLVDATSSETFHRYLLSLIAEGRTLNGKSGKLSATKSDRLSEILTGDPPRSSRVLKVEQSNTSIIYDEKIYLKLFRKLEEGVNPDLELTKHLSEKCDFQNVPTYLGDLQYTAPDQDPASIVMMQAFTPSEQNGWSHTLAAVDRYFDRVLAEPQLVQPPAIGLWEQIPEPFLSVIEGVHLETVRLLGERTADMHLALAKDTESPDFAPEPFTLQHQRSVYQSIRSETRQSISLLNRSLAQLDDYPKSLAIKVIDRITELSNCNDYLLQDTIIVKKIRIHGDYHLGQLQFTGKDFIILDFEGEPARSLGERRLKRSALIDVAGMIRSFNYAAHYGLLESRTVRPSDQDMLQAYGDLWSTRAAQVFLDAYLERSQDASFVPREVQDLKLLLRSYLISKAVYELRYELNNRPKWISIPLRGLISLLDEQLTPGLSEPA